MPQIITPPSPTTVQAASKREQRCSFAGRGVTLAKRLETAAIRRGGQFAVMELSELWCDGRSKATSSYDGDDQEALGCYGRGCVGAGFGPYVGTDNNKIGLLGT